MTSTVKQYVIAEYTRYVWNEIDESRKEWVPVDDQDMDNNYQLDDETYVAAGMETIQKFTEMVEGSPEDLTEEQFFEFLFEERMENEKEYDFEDFNSEDIESNRFLRDYLEMKNPGKGYIY